VQAVTGHHTDRMTEWYSHFNATEFAQVPKVQNSLLGIVEEPPKQDNPGGLHLVKPPVQQTA
jgi:hypothetical protein